MQAIGVVPPLTAAHVVSAGQSALVSQRSAHSPPKQRAFVLNCSHAESPPHCAVHSRSKIAPLQIKPG